MTKDVKESVEQIVKIANEGADLARLTVQGGKEANACQAIKDGCVEQGVNIPLVADIHFTPKVAMKVADSFEKIRVNPGNFADGFKTFEDQVYETREEYDASGAAIEEIFTPLVLKCKELGRAMRIGTNHGSLSARVMSFWGDTPRGMVESAVEFANICRKHNYHNFVFSMKASNPLVMVNAYRLLAAEMYKLGWDYPLHLGVTEAGEGEDGRIKSAIGIGSLLVDGLGDTVRVSLTEDPELEMVPCRTLVEIMTQQYDEGKFKDIPQFEETRDFEDFSKRKGDLPGQLDGDQFDIRGMMHRDGSVFSVVRKGDLADPDLLYRSLGAKMVVGMPFKDIATSDSIYLPEVPESQEERLVIKRLQDVAIGVLAPIEQLAVSPMPNTVAVITLESVVSGDLPPLPEGSMRYAVKATGLEPEAAYATLKQLSTHPRMTTLIVEAPPHVSRVHATRRAFELLKQTDNNMPVIHSLPLETANKEELILRAGAEAGALLVDGLGDGVMIDTVLDPTRTLFPLELVRTTSFNLLQGVRMRSTKTDFVSCPSCGRTLFDLQEVTDQIKVKTGHLPGVSIAIMGCIVNGPGEMADADFGYVGGAPGKVDLYVGKEVVKRGIPNEVACDALVDLIKENGRWVEKQVEEEVSQ
jgi:(E)-4-hydroxy-3-methylbut-2-enyl-diphosphate synthase